MGPAALGGVLKVAQGLIGLAGEAITDQDKKIEFQFKVLDRTFAFYEKILTTPTNPWVDAFVKIILVWGQLILPLLRPVGAFLLTAGAAYLHYKGTPLPSYLEAPLAAAFPGWMYSRHKDKIEKTKAGATPPGHQPWGWGAD